MPGTEKIVARSQYFGTLELNSSEAFHFAQGIPGFESERLFAPVEIPEQHPLLYLQSLSRADLCLITLPVRAIVSDYALELAPEDAELLKLAGGEEPRIGDNVLCLAIVTVDETHTPAANLLAPIVVNTRNREAVQSIQTGASYSHRHPIAPEPSPC